MGDCLIAICIPTLQFYNFNSKTFLGIPMNSIRRKQTGPRVIATGHLNICEPSVANSVFQMPTRVHAPSDQSYQQFKVVFTTSPQGITGKQDLQLKCAGTKDQNKAFILFRHDFPHHSKNSMLRGSNSGTNPTHSFLMKSWEFIMNYPNRPKM